MLTSSLDWRLCLKPCIQPPYWSFNFMDEAQYDAADSVGRPSKRRQGDTPYLSPDSSGSTAFGAINLKDKVHFLISILSDDS